MPYITQADRERLAGGDFPKTAGELNYLLTMRIKKEFTNKGKSYAVFNDIVAALEAAQNGAGISDLELEFSDMVAKYVYAVSDLAELDLRTEPPTEEEYVEITKRANSALGALVCAKFEFIRRVVSPYEDTKIASNGDVY